MTDIRDFEEQLRITLAAIERATPAREGQPERLIAATTTPDLGRSHARISAPRVFLPILAAASVVAIVVAALLIGTRERSTPPPPPATQHTTPVAPTSTPTPTPSASPSPVRTLTFTGTVSGKLYRATVWAERRNDPCRGHAYGAAVTAFIAQHRCTLAHRLLITTVVDGRPIAASIQQLSVPGTPSAPYRPATDFGTLLAAPHTGCTNDLLREGYRIPGELATIPPTEEFQVFNQDTGVYVVDAWYRDGAASDAALRAFGPDAAMAVG